MPNGSARPRSRGGRIAGRAAIGSIGAVLGIGIGFALGLGLDATAPPASGDPSPTATARPRPTPSPSPSPSPNEAVSASVAEAALRRLPEQPRALIIGDSFAEGIGGMGDGDQLTTIAVDRGWASLAADSLGWTATIDAIGGTGFWKDVATDGRTGVAYLQRLGLHAAAGEAYDVIVLQGGLNDDQATPLQERAAVTSAIRAAQAAWPDAAVIVFGPTEPLANGTERSRHAAVVGAAAVEAGAILVDPSAPVPWITAANSAGFDAGDGLHLSHAGYAYLAGRFAADIQSSGGTAEVGADARD